MKRIAFALAGTAASLAAAGLVKFLNDKKSMAAARQVMTERREQIARSGAGALKSAEEAISVVTEVASETASNIADAAVDTAKHAVTTVRNAPSQGAEAATDAAERVASGVVAAGKQAVARAESLTRDPEAETRELFGTFTARKQIFSVKLTSLGPDAEEVVKALASLREIGVPQARELISGSLPVTVLERGSREDAERFVRRLNNAGGHVSVE